jgi:hypothetical protein
MPPPRSLSLGAKGRTPTPRAWLWAAQTAQADFTIWQKRGESACGLRTTPVTAAASPPPPVVVYPTFNVAWPDGAASASISLPPRRSSIAGEHCRSNQHRLDPFLRTALLFSIDPGGGQSVGCGLDLDERSLRAPVRSQRYYRLSKCPSTSIERLASVALKLDGRIATSSQRPESRRTEVASTPVSMASLV